MAQRKYTSAGNSGASNVLISAPEAKALAAAIRGAGKEVRSSVRKRLKPAGEIIAVEIRSRTPVGATGKLRGSTRVRPSAMSVRIVNTATASSRNYKNYRYGKRLEFDPLYGGRYKFFYPGYEAKKAEAIAELAKVLDDVRDEFLTGGT